MQDTIGGSAPAAPAPPSKGYGEPGGKGMEIQRVPGTDKSHLLFGGAPTRQGNRQVPPGASHQVAAIVASDAMFCRIVMVRRSLGLPPPPRGHPPLRMGRSSVTPTWRYILIGRRPRGGGTERSPVERTRNNLRLLIPIRGEIRGNQILDGLSITREATEH